ncbi:MAG: tRNA pseudouridine(55) synthase TruB, partial [Candidatus Spechtbacterales bacterium]|nr:tRNA pseudouridine(55) synthase TruB [Candidatus Spechtbacterales bacterium]
MFLINKKPGPTSHDIVDEVRKITGVKKVGHAGTLDPFAEGLLIILVGRPETKRQSEFMGLDKVYEATLTLGAETDTFDKTGEFQISNFKFQNNEKIPISKINDVLKKFEGKQEQMPPIFSAKKVRGKKAYELARKGEIPKLKSKEINIEYIKLIEYSWPELKIETKVSSGTYIRA